MEIESTATLGRINIPAHTRTIMLSNYLRGCVNELDPSVGNGQYDNWTLSRIL